MPSPQLPNVYRHDRNIRALNAPQAVGSRADLARTLDDAVIGGMR